MTILLYSSLGMPQKSHKIAKSIHPMGREIQL